MLKEGSWGDRERNESRQGKTDFKNIESVDEKELFGGYKT